VAAAYGRGRRPVWRQSGRAAGQSHVFTIQRGGVSGQRMEGSWLTPWRCEHAGLAPCQRDLKVDECRYSTWHVHDPDPITTLVAVRPSSVLMMLMMRDVS
jgi:hypothetical protein